MCEPLLAHQVIRLKGCIKIVEVDTDRTAHEHVLRSLDNVAVALEKVGTLESFEAEEVVIEVTTVVKYGINSVNVVSDHVKDVFSEKRSVSALFVFVVVQHRGCCEHARRGAVVKGLHRNSIG